MLENKFKTGLIRELKERFPGCMVVHLDPNEIQGIPDLLVLYGTTWGALEGKKSASAPHRPNQDYYVQQMDEMWFSKTLQNWKALVSTTVSDGMYYEITHNGDKKETYLDVYKKWENQCIADGNTAH